MVNVGTERPDLKTLCKYTQTAEYLQDGFDENLDVDFTMDSEDFKELTHSQTQTNWGLTFGNLFEDNETQTFESYLELDQSTMDCATQTKTILDEIFSVDMETQTLIPAISFDADFEAINCGSSMDGQTQTLPWTTFADSDTMSLSMLQSSTSASMDEQTQTFPTYETTFDILQGSTLNVETQTAFNDISDNLQKF